MLVMAACSAITWLDFLYACSYAKLLITLVKYVPQAVMNYRRKSTMGWSIGNVLLDFSGGILSITQMFMLAYNSGERERERLLSPSAISTVILTLIRRLVVDIRRPDQVRARLLLCPLRRVLYAAALRLLQVPDTFVLY